MSQTNEQKLKNLLSEARKQHGNIPHKDADELFNAWKAGAVFGAMPHDAAPAKE